MVKVQLVTGPVEAQSLGRVLMHEHVALATVGLRENYPFLLSSRAEIVDRCVHRIGIVKAAGFDTIVDHTTFDLGRDPALLEEVSRRTGVNIVAATGIWISPPRWFQKRDADEIAQLFIGDLTTGIADTGIRAGVIKCALDRAGLMPAQEQILRAAARAHHATGAPISTHTWAEGRSGESQQRIFAEEGVDLGAVLIGHCGDTEDVGYLRRLLLKGSFIGMDRFGIEDYLSDERRAAVVAALCAEGFANQLMLSQDANSWSDRDLGLPIDPRRRHWHYLNLAERIIPMLRKLGVPSQQIDQMLIDNPRLLFERAHKNGDAVGTGI
ncbi:phosphotriesterase family protein [Marinivivus vitaminiproducens]|uniref:phosphotriesterase family protein n=1 Tax=Marinivivus vitaminiproducens TaxID=3035935 RepID=UPI0027A20F95|nr:hypothetical protein P4R82_21895 [Geminicoccaceae bacterium SCSIO 64248]